MNTRLDDRLGSAADSVRRSAGQLAQQGGRIVNDHPTAVILSSLLGLAAIASLAAFFLFTRDDD